MAGAGTIEEETPLTSQGDTNNLVKDDVGVLALEAGSKHSIIQPPTAKSSCDDRKSMQGVNGFNERTDSIELSEYDSLLSKKKSSTPKQESNKNESTNEMKMRYTDLMCDHFKEYCPNLKVLVSALKDNAEKTHTFDPNGYLEKEESVAGLLQLLEEENNENWNDQLHSMKTHCGDESKEAVAGEAAEKTCVWILSRIAANVISNDKIWDAIEMCDESGKLVLVPVSGTPSATDICAGCDHEFGNVSHALVYQVEDSNPTRTRYFHDARCVQLRKCKEKICVYDQREAGARDAVQDEENVDIALRRRKTSMSSRTAMISTLATMRAKSTPMQFFKSPRTGSSSGTHNGTDELENKIKTALKQVREYLVNGPNQEEKSDLPEVLSITDMSGVIGERLFEYCVVQLSFKDRPKVWKVLNYVVSKLPTGLAIRMIEKFENELFRFRVESLNKMFCVIISEARYPEATALFIASIIKIQTRDLMSVYLDYIAFVESRLSQIENDFLLALIMEIPSDIEGLSIWQITIERNVEKFVEFHRLDPMLAHLWHETDYLDPSKCARFEKRELTVAQTWDKLRKNPWDWYFSPVGQYVVELVFYVFYVLLVTTYAGLQIYPYTTDKHVWFQWVFWCANIGYAVSELVEIWFRRCEYFSDITNVWDCFICAVWIALGILHITWSADDDADGYSPETRETHLRDDTTTQLFMIFFAFQLVLVWTRLITFFRRNSRVGPLLQMIEGMIYDIVNFAMICLLFMTGFVFTLYYVSNGDVDDLHTVPLCFLYAFQVLVGQNDWDALDVSGDAARTQLLNVLVVIFCIIAPVLLLNLLIALMSNTFQKVDEKAPFHVKFNKLVETWQMATKGALMPMPFNVIVIVVSLIYGSARAILFCLCRGGWKSILSCNDCNCNCKECKCECDRTGKDQFCAYCRKEVNLTINQTASESFEVTQEAKPTEKDGNLGKFINLLNKKGSLDSDDIEYVQSMMRRRKLCYNCHRPYVKTLDRSQRLLELASCWVFLGIFPVLLFVMGIVALAIEFYLGIKKCVRQSRHGNQCNADETFDHVSQNKTRTHKIRDQLIQIQKERAEQK